MHTVKEVHAMGSHKAIIYLDAFEVVQAFNGSNEWILENLIMDVLKNCK